MSSIHERTGRRGDRSFVVAYGVEGRQHSRTFKTRDAAQRWRAVLDAVGPAKALEMLTLDEPDERLARSVADQVESYVATLTEATDGTRYNYRRMARLHLGSIASVPLTALDEDRVALWLRELEAKGLGVKTRKNVHGMLSASMKRAVRHGLLTKNPAEGLNPRRTVDASREEMVFLTAAEMARLLSYMPEHERALPLLLWATGLRWGEATALRVGDVDVERQVLHVRRAWKDTGTGARELGTTKTIRGNRDVPYGEVVARALEPLLERLSGELLFTNRRGNRVAQSTWHKNVWAPAVRRFAGDEISHDVVTYGGKRRLVETTLVKGRGRHPRVHDLRHSYASNALRGGVPIAVVSRSLGHEDISTTANVYGHLLTDDLAAVTRLNDAAWEALTPVAISLSSTPRSSSSAASAQALLAA